MVQKGAASSRVGVKQRGRPPKFDRDAVIDAAIGAFWEGGLEATTLPELEAATGIDRSTLYSSFGGKQGLYELATERYLDTAETRLLSPLLEGTDDGLADIVEFLSRLGQALTTAEAGGCLVINNIARGDDPRPGRRYRRMLHDGLVDALRRAGVAPRDVVEQRAGLLAASVIGVNIMSRSGASSDEIGTTIDGMIAQVHAWAG